MSVAENVHKANLIQGRQDSMDQATKTALNPQLQMGDLAISNQAKQCLSTMTVHSANRRAQHAQYH